MPSYDDYVSQLTASLRGLVVTNRDNEMLSQEEGLKRFVELAETVRRSRKTLYFVGNGASAMMAGHMAADACKNGGLRSLAFNDAALMTAISNDISYEQCFSYPLMRFAEPGDVLVAISSSGNSPNIVAAIGQARKQDLAAVVSLTGFRPDNKARRLGDVNFYVPAATYGLVEAAHQTLLHCWLDVYMDTCPGEAGG